MSIVLRLLKNTLEQNHYLCIANEGLTAYTLQRNSEECGIRTGAFKYLP